MGKNKIIKKGDRVQSLSDHSLKGSIVFMSMVDPYEAYVLWDGRSKGEFVKTYMLKKIDDETNA